MKNYISFVEIPVTDFDRAKAFYQLILGIQIDDVNMGETQMGLFPNDGNNVSAAIITGEGQLPSKDGVTVYLNGGEDLQVILDKVEPNGGKVHLQKTEISDSGYYAVFIDTEGNRIALMSAG